MITAASGSAKVSSLMAGRIWGGLTGNTSCHLTVNRPPPGAYEFGPREAPFGPPDRTISTNGLATQANENRKRSKYEERSHIRQNRGSDFRGRRNLAEICRGRIGIYSDRNPIDCGRGRHRVVAAVDFNRELGGQFTGSTSVAGSGPISFSRGWRPRRRVRDRSRR